LPPENPTWDVHKITAALVELGQPVSAATLARYRGRPAPSPSWRTLLLLHASEI